jgi:hypothetical protein
MSDGWLILIPTDPEWVPDAQQAARALEAIDQLTPERSGEIETFAPGRVEFVNCGENFESIGCPACGATLLDGEWWGERMSAAYDRASGFGALDVVTPCCGSATTLNDLDYHFPQGFASWWIEVHTANRGWLDDAERTLFETALSHPVREIRLYL